MDGKCPALKIVSHSRLLNIAAFSLHLTLSFASSTKPPITSATFVGQAIRSNKIWSRSKKRKARLPFYCLPVDESAIKSGFIIHPKSANPQLACGYFEILKVCWSLTSFGQSCPCGHDTTYSGWLIAYARFRFRLRQSLVLTNHCYSNAGFQSKFFLEWSCWKQNSDEANLENVALKC